jgi:virginiamycin B lyase
MKRLAALLCLPVLLLCVFTVALVTTPNFVHAEAGRVREFAIPPSGGGPYGITSGPRHYLWFTEISSNQIGRLTPRGVITEFALPFLEGNAPYGITSGPDGNLWFTEINGNQIGRLTPRDRGVITEFAVPTPNSMPYGITSGPDGNLWFAEWNGYQIGRITPQGVITEFAIPTPNSGPIGITSGPDGNLWFTEIYSNKIGRITTH